MWHKNQAGSSRVEVYLFFLEQKRESNNTVSLQLPLDIPVN